MMSFFITILIVAALALSAFVALAWRYQPSRVAMDRQAASRRQVMVAEAQIDYLTRQTMQAMRDVVREEARTRKSNVVIEGTVVE